MTLALASLACGCGDSAAGDGGETSGSTGEPSASTSFTGTTASTGVDGSSESGSSSGGDPCAEPPPVGEPAAWPSYGLDPANTRFNQLEVALSPERIACVQEQWSLGPFAGVTSTPAVVDGTVYFGDWDGLVHAVSAVDGGEVWSASVGVAVNDSPLVTDDAVFVGDDDGFLHRLARADGSIAWTVELDAHEAAVIYSSPVLADDVLVIGVASIELASVLRDYTFRGSVVGLDPATGAELWRVYTTEDDATSGAGVSVWSSAAVDAERGTVYIGTGNTYEEPAAPRSDALMSIDSTTGDIVWLRQFTEGDVYTIFMRLPQGPDADIGAAPNLFAIGKEDVVGVGDKAGVYAVLDRDSGDTVWATQLGEGSHLGGVMTTAAVGDGAIYLASNTWIDIFDFADPGNSSVTYALDADDGAILWQQPNTSPVFGAFTLAAGVVYHGSVDGTVHARDAASGEELWTIAPGGDIGSGFSVVDGRLLVGHGFWFFTQPAEPMGGFTAYGLPR